MSDQRKGPRGVYFRVTPEQHERLARAADREGLSVGTYARRAALVASVAWETEATDPGGER